MSKTVNILTAVNNFLGTTSVTGDATVDTNIRPHIDSKLESFLYQNNLHKVASGANLKLLLFTIFSNAIASGITPRTSPIKAMLFDNYQSDRLDAFVIRQSALEGAPVTMHVVTCITNLETVHQNLPAVFNENRYKQIQLWAQENGVSEDQFQQKMQNIKTIAIKRGNVQPANAQGATTSFYNVETEPGFFYQFRQSGISPLIVDSTVNVGSVTSTANDVEFPSSLQVYPTSANNRNGIETLKTKSYSAFKTKHIQGRRVEPLFVRSQVLFALDSTIMLNLPLSRENNPLVLLGAAFVKQDRLHLKVSTELIGSRHSNTIEQIGKIVIQRIVGTGVTQIYGEPLLCEFIDRALFEDPYRQVSPDSSFMPSHLMVTEARRAHFVEVSVPVLMDDEFRSAKINLRRTKPILEHLIDPKTSQDTKIQHLQSTMDKVTSMHGTENIESYFLGQQMLLGTYDTYGYTYVYLPDPGVHKGIATYIAIKTSPNDCIAVILNIDVAGLSGETRTPLHDLNVEREMATFLVNSGVNRFNVFNVEAPHSDGDVVMSDLRNWYQQGSESTWSDAPTTAVQCQITASVEPRKTRLLQPHKNVDNNINLSFDDFRNRVDNRRRPTQGFLINANMWNILPGQFEAFPDSVDLIQSWGLDMSQKTGAPIRSRQAMAAFTDSIFSSAGFSVKRLDGLEPGSEVLAIASRHANNVNRKTLVMSICKRELKPELIAELIRIKYQAANQGNRNNQGNIAGIHYGATVLTKDDEGKVAVIIACTL